MVFPATTGQFIYPEHRISWMYRHRGTLANDFVINSTLKDITSLIALLPLDTQVTDQPLYYDNINDVFKVKTNRSHHFHFFLYATLTGFFSSNASGSLYKVFLTRSNGDEIRSFDFVRMDSIPQAIDFTLLFTISTFVFENIVDNYQSDGFKIKIQKRSGSDLTLTTLDSNNEPALQEFRFFQG